MADESAVQPIYNKDRTLLRFKLSGDALRGANIATCETLVATLDVSMRSHQRDATVSLPLSERENAVLLNAVRLYWYVLGREAEDKNAELAAGSPEGGTQP